MQAKTAQDKAGDYTQAAKDKAGDLSGSTKDTAGQTQDKAGDYAQTAKDKASSAADTLGSKVRLLCNTDLESSACFSYIPCCDRCPSHAVDALLCLGRQQVSLVCASYG